MPAREEWICGDNGVCRYRFGDPLRIGLPADTSRPGTDTDTSTQPPASVTLQSVVSAALRISLLRNADRRRDEVADTHQAHWLGEIPRNCGCCTVER